MTWNFDDLKTTASEAVQAASDLKALEACRIQYLGKKGLVAEIYASLAQATAQEKPLIGKGANELKNTITTLIEEKKKALEAAGTASAKDALDVTLPGVTLHQGHKHLLTQTIEEICDLFVQLGFVIHDGPEVETEFHNFDALNIPPEHPSRDGFDTFYTNLKDPETKNGRLLLRSQTSPVQIRVMKNHKPPLAIIAPGKVYRPDAVDASHSFMFHQIEGLLVDKNVRFSDLKGLLEVFCRKFFGKNIRMRFRPHFFPFTEPSAEVDISWEQGKKSWLEIMGCGMVHPQVFEAVGYPKGKYTGLAFGMGVERIAMLRHGIKDIRTFFENDNRFLNQF